MTICILTTGLFQGSQSNASSSIQANPSIMHLERCVSLAKQLGHGTKLTGPAKHQYFLMLINCQILQDIKLNKNHKAYQDALESLDFSYQMIDHMREHPQMQTLSMAIHTANQDAERNSHQLHARLNGDLHFNFESYLEYISYEFTQYASYDPRYASLDHREHGGSSSYSNHRW